MGIKIISVELKNIRAHSHVFFEPKIEGITVIQGDNGTGKSSIVDSIAWCLMGTKPKGVARNKDIFKVGIEDDDPAWVKVVFTVDGQKMCAKKRKVDKKGATELDVFSVERKDDGSDEFVHVAGPSVSHAESYIRHLLSMDEKGFLAAVLVQQKQVDQLISSPRKERGRVIEKLTGIAGLTSALTESKQELNAIKKVASLSTVEPEKLESLKNEGRKLSSSVKTLKAEGRSFQEKISVLKQQGEKARSLLNEKKSLYKKRDDLEKELSSLNVEKKVKEENLVEAVKKKQEYKSQLPDGVSSQSLNELKKLMQNKEQQVRNLTVETEKLKQKKSDLEQGVLSRKKTLEGVSDVNDEEKVVRELIVSLERDVKNLENSLSEGKGEKESLLQAVSVITNGDNCPTCLQKVGDPTAAEKSLRGSMATLDASLSEIRNNIDVKKTELSAASGLLEKVVLRNECLVWVDEAQKELKIVKRDLDKTSSELKIVDNESKVLFDKHEKTQQEEHIKKTYQDYADKTVTLTQEIEKIETKVDKINETLSGLGSSSEKEVVSLQKKVDDLLEKYGQYNTSMAEKKGEIELSNQKLEHIKEEVKRYEKEMAEYKSVLKSLEVAAHTYDLIGEFREEKIKTSIPIIDSYASDLINRFTDGKFVRLSLNKNFEATVYLADGTPRAIGLLSGGELSSAAIALRIAVSLLLNTEENQNLIILDEVLVSQDATRAEQILSTIKEVVHGQVILISHNDSVSSIADSIFEIGK